MIAVLVILLFIMLLVIIVVMASRTRKYVVYAHYDADAIIKDYVKMMIDTYEQLGYDVIFVSNNPRTDVSGLGVSVAITRENTGYDFGAWTSVIDYFKDGTEVIFTNDSYYGPLDGIDKFRSVLRRDRAEMTGLTESEQLGTYHLQSYFLRVEGSALPTFIEFLRQIPSDLTFRQTIEQCELACTKYMKDHGITTTSIFTSRDRTKNPYLDDWEWLRSQGYPFLKRRYAGSTEGLLGSYDPSLIA
jgi:lipopolysaccharide biosynthesis protein